MIIDRKSAEKEPVWQGDGPGLLDALRNCRGEIVRSGFLEIELPFEFCDTFKYPIIIELKSTGSVMESVAIAFRVPEEIHTAKGTFKENAIVPKVMNFITRDHLVHYFSALVEKQSKVSFYLDDKPEKLEKLKFYVLTDKQKIVFNEFFVMAIESALEKKKK
jgi:hypothetical protein